MHVNYRFKNDRRKVFLVSSYIDLVAHELENFMLCSNTFKWWVTDIDLDREVAVIHIHLE